LLPFASTIVVHRWDFAFEKLRRCVADDFGGPVGHQPDATGDGEQQGGDDDAGEQAAPRRALAMVTAG